ncbi:MAG: hypothetical protein Q8904_15315 [Bacteroidota bacterium]|nr:hypothetical protein [Bacteroidota bacterium]
MKRISKTITFITVVMVLSSCASIVSRSSWPLTVKSEPIGASVQITNRQGISVFSGQTPATILLKSSAGFFTAESYLIKLTLDGYAEKTIPVNCRLNGWYFGNIIFGGVIGLLIVDPATGAMYRLDTPYIDEALTPKTTSDNGPALKVVSINDLSQDMRNHLVSIK